MWMSTVGDRIEANVVEYRRRCGRSGFCQNFIDIDRWL